MAPATAVRGNAGFVERSGSRPALQRSARGEPAIGYLRPELRALASFTYDCPIAQCFGNLLFVASVPRQRILATPVTGFAAFGEAEVLVLGPSAAADQVECVITP